LGSALLGEPEGEPITVEVAGSANLEFKFDLEMDVSLANALGRARRGVIAVSPPNWLRLEVRERRSILAATVGLRSDEYT
jgi:hypothetical protein